MATQMKRETFSVLEKCEILRKYENTTLNQNHCVHFTDDCFAFAFGSGMVHLFEKNTDYSYYKRNLFVIPEPAFKEDNKDLNIVQCLSISTTQSRLLVSAQHSQLYFVNLWERDLTQAAELKFTMFGEQLHHGKIAGLSICAWKPLFMTCGLLDQTVRVWNYITETQELTKQYQSKIYTVTIHPTGLYCIIGFSETLCFMIILLDDIQVIREFPVHGCHECVFSSSGHLFAAVCDNVIHVYSSISYENLYNFKGHSKKITSIVWTMKDTKLVSCGIDGAIYEWDIKTGSNISKIISRECQFYSVAATTTGKTAYGTGSTGQIVEVSESSIVNTVDVMSQQLNCIILSRSNLIMFAGSETGCVLSVKIPIHPVKFAEHCMHNSPLTRMQLTFDDLTLITCSEDGSLCIWSLKFAEGKTVKVDTDFKFFNDILHNKKDLLEKLKLIEDLSARADELIADHASHMEQLKEHNEQKIKEVHEGYNQAIEELKDKNEQLQVNHTNEIGGMNKEIDKLKKENEMAVATLETNFNEKLIVEHEKYQELEVHTNKMKEDYERKLLEIAIETEEDIRNLTEEYETQLQEQGVEMTELSSQSQQQLQEHESIKRRIEDDADHEIVDVKAHYEALLHEEREMNLKLKADASSMKKKFISLQKEIEEYKQQVQTLQQEQHRLQRIIFGLEQDISDLKKEISERNTTIHDKEKQISDLKRKNEELEKFRLVLNYKIKELDDHIQPMNMKIQEKNEQMKDMKMEMDNLLKTNATLKLQLVELQEKLTAANNEFTDKHQQNREANALLRCIKLDIHNASSLAHDSKKLKDAVRLMYHKYGQDPDFATSHTQGSDPQTEYMQQREHLERTLASLKRQLHKGTSKKDDVQQILEKNGILKVEINKLRLELKSLQEHVSNMQSIMGPDVKCVNPREARTRLKVAVQKHEKIHDDYKKKLQDKDQLILTLKDEVQRLVQKLNKREQDENKTDLSEDVN